MTGKSSDDPQPKMPAEVDVELRPDGWERFEKAVDAAAKTPGRRFDRRHVPDLSRAFLTPAEVSVHLALEPVYGRPSQRQKKTSKASPARHRSPASSVSPKVSDQSSH
jgi:hypothetical protein